MLGLFLTNIQMKEDILNKQLCQDLYEFYNENSRSTSDIDLKNKYQLLSEVSSLDFNIVDDLLDSKSPFKPAFFIYGPNPKRSAALEDFDKKKLEELISLLEEEKNTDLCARIADILQSNLKDSRRVEYSKRAVNYYLAIARSMNIIDKEKEVVFRMIRAAQIALLYQSSDEKNMAENIASFLKERLSPVKISKYIEIADLYGAINWLRICLVRGLFNKIELYSYGELAIEIGKKLEGISGGLRSAEICYNLAKKFFSESKMINVCLEKLAFVKQRLAETAPNIFTKVKYFRESLCLFRKCGSKKYMEKISNIEKILDGLQKQASKNNMKTLEIKSSIPNEVESHLKTVMTNKSFQQKIIELSKLFDFISPERAVTYVKENKGAFHGTFDFEVSDHNHKRINPLNNTQSIYGLSPEDEFLLKVGVFEWRSSLITLAKQFAFDDEIYNAQEIDFLFNSCAWLPDSNTNQVKRGILAGLNNDWMMFSLFVIPVFETMLSNYLKKNNIPNFKQHADGSQEKYSLNELLEKDETKELLGNNLTFELHFLLINKTGYGVRHLASHGELTDRQYNENAGIKLFWWLLIKLFCRTNAELD